MSSRTLVTGFGPFGSVNENPSEELARGSRRLFEILEVSYDAVDRFVFNLAAGSFDTWLMLGVAGGRKKLSAELFARNHRGGKDVRGMDAGGEVEAGGPLLVQATLWNPELLASLVAERTELSVSMDAGTYLCNYLSYRALRTFPEKQIGFLHVVLGEELDLKRQAETVEAVLEAAERAQIAGREPDSAGKRSA